MIKFITSKLQVGEPPDRRLSQEQEKEAETPAEVASEAATSEPFIGRGPNLRLLADTDETRGGLLYRLVNRLTGEVVSEITRDDLAKHNANPNYIGGAWLDTKA